MESNILFSVFAWKILPSAIASLLQRIYYRFVTPVAARRCRVWCGIYALVIFSYFCYTLYGADQTLTVHERNFYEDLNVTSFAARDKEIHSRYRRGTSRVHPDKFSNLPSDRYSVSAEGILHAKLALAKDVLLDPAQRFAYDRFGLAATEWKDCTIKIEYIRKGLNNIFLYYVAAYTGMVTSYIFGYAKRLIWWQVFLTTALLVLELNAITRTEFPSVLTKIINPLRTSPLLPNQPRLGYLPYQFISIARSAVVSFVLALYQIEPVWRQAVLEVAKYSGDSTVIEHLTKDTDQIEHESAAVFKSLVESIMTVDSQLVKMRAAEIKPWAGSDDALREAVLSVAKNEAWDTLPEVVKAYSDARPSNVDTAIEI